MVCEISVEFFHVFDIVIHDDIDIGAVFGFFVADVDCDKATNAAGNANDDNRDNVGIYDGFCDVVAYEVCHYEKECCDEGFVALSKDDSGGVKDVVAYFSDEKRNDAK